MVEIKKRIKFLMGKLLKFFLLGLLVLIIMNLLPAFFYKPEFNSNKMLSSYVKGVYHMHSTFSDGKGNIEEITSAASSLKLDFAILTDHGRPNLGSSTATQWRNGVLLVGATELSLTSGHLVAMGFDNPNYIYPSEPQEAVDDIRDSGGVCIIAHPFDDKIPWTDWSVKGYNGLEVYSSYNEARRTGILKILIFPLKYAINSKYALLDTMRYPEEVDNTWDRLNQSSRYFGIYALDVHGKIKITDKIQLYLPTYRSMFELMTVYVKIQSSLNQNSDKAAREVISSFRRGAFFNVIEAIAPANGFDAYFIDGISGKTIDMGSGCDSPTGKIIIRAPFKFKTNIRILRDGMQFKEIKNNKEKYLEINITEKGVYRIEVTVPGNKFHELPWIMTNPFYIGLPSPPPYHPFNDNPEVLVRRSLLDLGINFKLEKNLNSRGEITLVESEINKKIIRFYYKLSKNTNEKDYWCSMALRQDFDFSQYKGIVLEIKSDRRQRFWTEFRSKGISDNSQEFGYSYSFLATPNWKRISIPFNMFHRVYGVKQDINLKKVVSFFLTINNGNAYIGTEGVLYIKTIGLY